MNHPFDPFLDAWEEAGGNAALDLRLRVYQALSLEGDWDMARVRVTLLAILGVNDAERARFDVVFDRAFAGLLLPPLGTGPSGEPELVQVSAPTFLFEQQRAREVATYEKRRHRSWRFLVPAVLLAGTVLVGGQVGPISDGDTTLASSTPSQTIPVPQPTSTDQPAQHQLPVKPSEPILEATRAPPREWWRPLRPWAGYVTAIGAFIVLCLLISWGRFLLSAKRRFKPSKVSVATIPPRGPDLDLRSAESCEPLTRRELGEIAYNLVNIDAEGTGDVDIDRTVEATARDQRLAIIHKGTTRPPCVLVLLGAPLDIVADQVVEQFQSGLTRLGLAVDSRRVPPGRFEYDAGLWVADAREVPADHRAWFLSHRNIAIIEARDPALWGPEISNLPAQPRALTAAGLRRALQDALRGRRDPPQDYFNELEPLERLGSAAPIATAAALVQPVDLPTLDQLRRRFAPNVPFIGLQRLTGLSGVLSNRGALRFSPELQAELKLQNEHEGNLEPAEVLKWHLRHRLLPTKALQGSRADAMRKREMALVNLQLFLLGGGLTEQGVEEHVTVLEAQLDQEEMATRVRRRIEEAGGWLTKKTDETTNVLSGGLQSRLAGLGLSQQVRRALSKAEKRTASMILAVALAYGVVTALFGGLAYSCPDDQAACGKACLDRGRVCDACEGLCAADERCVASKCSKAPCGGTCPDGATCCGEACVVTAIDKLNCGVCGGTCRGDEVCNEGTCKRGCPSDQQRCVSGCSDLQSDPANCGRCDSRCSKDQQCVGGKCELTRAAAPSCPTGLVRCGGACVNAATDSSNCGACGRTCNGAKMSGDCVAGVCEVCSPGFANCDGFRCIDLRTDARNCGACGVSCDGFACQDGKCGCTECGGRCVDLASDESNCGKCGNPCAATETCEGGQCGCPAGSARCSGRCTELDSPTDCGKCGMTCRQGEACVNGRCECPQGFATCEGGKGGLCKVHVTFDPKNCGGCGVVCPSGNCSLGKCLSVTIAEECDRDCGKTADACLAKCQPVTHTLDLRGPEAPAEEKRWSESIDAVELQDAAPPPPRVGDERALAACREACTAQKAACVKTCGPRGP